MDLVIKFYENNIVLIFFVCGLGFFATGFAVALEARRSRNQRLISGLPLLAGFGVLLGIAFWAEMLLAGQSLYLGDRSYSIRVIKVMVMALGGLCVGQFGATLLASTDRKLYWLRWLPPALFTFWLFSAVVPHLYSFAGAAPLANVELCVQCHSTTYPAYTLASREWLTGSDIVARYLLYFPGGLLAALGMLRLRPLLSGMNLPEIASDAGWCAAGFTVSALIVGLVPPPAAFFPASFINYGSFFATLGVPAQLFSAASALVIAIFTIRMLRVFAIEEERELERVNTARFKAQQELLEAQRQAQAEMELWNMQLEARIERRTAELEKLNRNLEATNSIAKAVSQSLRLEEVLNATLDKVLSVMQARAGGVFILDNETGDVAYSVSRGLSEAYERGINLAGLDGRPMEHSGSSETMLVEDVITDPRIARLVVEKEGLQSFASVSLRSKGRVLGALSVATPRPRKLTEDDVNLLKLIANQVAVAVENAQLFEETRWREREAEAVFKVSQEILALMDIDRIFGSVLEHAMQLVRTDAAALALVDERTGEIYMKATRGIRTEAFKRLRNSRSGGLAGVVIRTGQAFKVRDYQESSNITHELDDVIEGENVKAFLAAPLKTGEGVVGILYVLQRHVHHFSEHDSRLLASLASHATIALENARLYDQVQQLAILSERGRIAREMHDGLAQVLGYLLLNSRTVASMLSSGRVPEAFDELEKMRETIREAYNDVRGSILGLRNSASVERKGLMPGLAEFLEDFTMQTGIQTELIGDESQGIALTPSAETQLVRVIQEALTNVRKHAQASHAWVRMERDGDQAVITVEDNGRGFYSTSRSGYPSPGHFGLQIMRERAESVGGSLEVESFPGQGTKIIVRLPCALTPMQVKT